MYISIEKQKQYSSLLNAPLLDEYEIERADLMREFQVNDDVENEYDGTMDLLVKSNVAKVIYAHKREGFGDLEMGAPTTSAESENASDKTLLGEIKRTRPRRAASSGPKDTKLAIRIPFAAHYRPFVWRYVLDAMNATLERRRRRSAPSKLGTVPEEMMNIIDVDVPRCRLCPIEDRVS